MNTSQKLLTIFLLMIIAGVSALLGGIAGGYLVYCDGDSQMVQVMLREMNSS